jgi:hypothetical protein
MINFVSMATQESGDGWTVEVKNGLMVWEFLPGMKLSEFGQDAYDTFDELLRTNRINAMVTVVELDDPFSSEVFDVWEKSANRASEAGLKKWAIVADGIKSISLRGKIDTGDLDTFTSENRTEAIDWARD